jgi:hypothetical protein
MNSVRIYGIQSKIARQRLGHFSGINNAAKKWYAGF